MQHFPIYLDLEERTVLVAGGGEAALAKLRLIAKTPATILVVDEAPSASVVAFCEDHQITVTRRALRNSDVEEAALVYCAAEDPIKDSAVRAIANAAGTLVNVVDNLEESDFITPAIVDRSPVTVAIGTEGAAPVLARAIKRKVEEWLPTETGTLARIGKTARAAIDVLPSGKIRREFWQSFFFTVGPRALASKGENGVREAIDDLIVAFEGKKQAGKVDFVGAGPGNPDLLTLRARSRLDEADVVLHDALVPSQILELARREAEIVNVGKRGFARSTKQSDINALIVSNAIKGKHVVRLKSGDPTLFGRLDEEIEACDQAGVDWTIVPGITASSASAASIGQSLTKRDRNSSIRFLTGHDMKGFAEHEWKDLAQPGAVAAVYMGKRTARFWQGRLLMHGANSATPMAIVENASQPGEQVISTTLGNLHASLTAADLQGPALILHGLSSRSAISAELTLSKQELA